MYKEQTGMGYDIICPPKSQKIAFFRYFSSLNEVNLKFIDVKGNFISFKL